jgi:hypothetical protein
VLTCALCGRIILQSALVDQTPGRRGFVAALLEGGNLVYLPEEAEGLADGLEGPLYYPGRVAQHVPGHPARQVCCALGEVPGVLGVDVVRVDPCRTAVDAPAGAKVLGEVEQLVRALDPARRAGEYGVLFDFQRAAPFTARAPSRRARTADRPGNGPRQPRPQPGDPPIV